MGKRMIAIAAVAVAAVVVGGASAHSAATNSSRLQRFESCAQFLDYVHGQAMPLITPWGFEWWPDGATTGTTGTTGVVPAPTPSAPGVTVSPDLSGTNVQEPGVDEPDIVKADRWRLFALVRGNLFAVDLRRRPRVAGSLELDPNNVQQLLLHGNRLYVIDSGRSSGGRISPDGRVIHDPVGSGPVTTITQIDVSDPSELRVAGRLELHASYVSARVVGRSARLVVSSFIPHDIAFVRPTDSTSEAKAAALAENRAILAASGPANWLPHYTLENAAGASGGLFPACDQVSRPSEASGLGLLSVLTLDLAQGLQPLDADGILSDGQTVYSSASGLYVATEPRSIAPAPGLGAVVVTLPAGIWTAVHKFDISKPTMTSYRASGAVLGAVRDQWSLSEHETVLRVVSTRTRAGIQQDTRVTSLAEQNGELVELGHVGDLGRNESVYAIRFIGEIGYVVTFRQTDPLYTLDLSDPSRPRVRGKLDLFGWSSYLHPLSGDLLLGVGQDATAFGASLGTQLSIFDVGNLNRPRRLDRRLISYSSSQAETDHHAFLYWPATRLVVLPIEREAPRFIGAFAYRVVGGRLDEVASIQAGSHLRRVRRLVQWSEGRRVPVLRSVVVKRTLYTVSEVGVRANDAATLGDAGWAGFEEAAPARAPRD